MAEAEQMEDSPYPPPLLTQPGDSPVQPMSGAPPSRGSGLGQMVLAAAELPLLRHLLAAARWVKEFTQRVVEVAVQMLTNAYLRLARRPTGGPTRLMSVVEIVQSADQGRVSVEELRSRLVKQGTIDHDLQSPATATSTNSCAVDDEEDDGDDVVGSVHSLESMSAVDGPGLRYLIFLQGCPRRCQFCSNPDTWNLEGGKQMKASELARRIKRCRTYLQPNGGGITISGGEALLQPRFVAALFKHAHSFGLTTCMDTSGWGTEHDWNLVLPHTDLVMLCLKSHVPETYKELTGTTARLAFEFADALQARGVKFWLRYVMIPGMTDSEEEISAMEDFLAEHPCCEAVELLPYHRLGVHKWEALGMAYPMPEMAPPPRSQVAAVTHRLQNVVKVIIQE